MKTLHYVHSNNLSKLHDEILAAVPSLQPIVGDDGERHALMRVEGKDDEIYLTVPDDADEAAIQAVIDAHDPTPRPQAPTIEEQVATMKLALDALILGV